MTRLAVLFLLLLVFAPSGGVVPLVQDEPEPAAEPSATIDELLEEIRARYEQPAIAAAVVKSGRIVASGAVGERTNRAPDRVQIDDRFHIGSCAKAATATMIATLIEEGALTWETTLIDVFPELDGVLHEKFATVTLDQLLTHRAGVAPYTQPTPEQGALMHGLSGTPTEQRRAFVELALREAPESEPGTAFEYSNAGYGIAAAMAERVTGIAWEELMRTRVFEPLEMKHSGFGWPLDADEAQPWGHMQMSTGLVGIPPQAYFLPPALDPAGDVHMSIGDFARFVQCHLAGLRGESTILRPETVRKLHTPALNNYAYGWAKREDLFGAPATGHAGSAGTFFSWMHLWADRDIAIVVVTNAGTGADACTDVTKALMDRFRPSD